MVNLPVQKHPTYEVTVVRPRSCGARLENFRLAVKGGIEYDS